MFSEHLAIPCDINRYRYLCGCDSSIDGNVGMDMVMDIGTSISMSMGRNTNICVGMDMTMRRDMDMFRV